MNKILNLIFFDPWSIVPNFFSFPTLLARATYMIYGGRGGGEKSNGLVSTPCSPPPTHGVGEGRGPIFRLIPPVTNTLWL